MSSATTTVRPADITARIAVYPSAAIHPIPSFVFTVPEGFVLDEGPDCIALVRTAEEVDGFWPNVVVMHDRVAVGADLKIVAQATWAELLRTSPGAKSTMERVVSFNGQVTYLRAVEMPAPRSGEVLAQLHSLTFAPGAADRKTLDLFQMISTCTAPQADAYGKRFLEVIGSLRFT